MAIQILSEKYPPRKPLLTITADSLSELPTEGVAEGSVATVGGTQYVYENNSGWIVPGSGGGGGGSDSNIFLIELEEDPDGTPSQEGDIPIKSKQTVAEFKEAVEAGKTIIPIYQGSVSEAKEVRGYVSFDSVAYAASGDDVGLQAGTFSQGIFSGSYAPYLYRLSAFKQDDSGYLKGDVFSEPYEPATPTGPKPQEGD